MLDNPQIEEAKARLCDRYTASELVELLDLQVEDIVEEYWDYLIQFHPEILEEIGF